jgi:hypothetical protein
MANRQHGIVSIRQLRGPLGYSERTVVREAERGELHRLYRGVYAVGHARVSTHARCLAAALACGPNALLSHTSAAWLWGVSTQAPFPLHVTAPERRRPRRPIVLHHARALLDRDWTLVEMIPVTSLARTFLDSAAIVRGSRLERMLERAEELKLFDLAPVKELLERTAGHPGHGRLRRAVELYRPTSFTRSGLERRFLALVREAGLPQPRASFVEHGFELDVYWPEERFAVELDTYGTHGSHGAFERDRLRREELLLEGIEMIQVTDLRLAREPERVIERVARLWRQSGERVRRERQGRRGCRGPAG